MEARTSRIKRRLVKDGWYLERHGSNHDIYRHPAISGIITLPRHPTVSDGVAISIAKKAGWTD
ncbi:MAG: type II toxin-antitoxin system HicA family toxin [Bryobacterales bacterium]|nr:type II toxin-antitoxin system HicA family toxin [Bryobacterales bacterium]